MKIGFIGLGKMGQNMVMRLLEQEFSVVGYNRTREVTDSFISQIPKPNDQTKTNFFAAYSLAELVKQLVSPRVIWLMVAAGNPVDEVINELLAAGLTTGDTVIDGGNSFYKDSLRRYNMLKLKNINFIDCGTSGGLSGARHGACLMLGGEKEVVEKLNWLWQTLAVAGGFAYLGSAGVGHFVKMVHNGIEYGMDEALGEGFEILSKGSYQLDLAKVAKVWNQGSVIRGWLMELLTDALTKEAGLHNLTGIIGGGKTGKEALETAKELRVEAPVLEKALEARAKSQTTQTFGNKVVSALRQEYGGHPEAKASE